MLQPLKTVLTWARHPVSPEVRALHQRAWAGLPARWRTPRQMYGRHGLGCGATLGAMPRCDFACTGCYLGKGANGVPAASVDEVRAQMRLLRERLGRGGNLQLTDGEVTLRREEELVALLRAARAEGLIPMLMTHGDSFRRRPGLLERLMREGGLTEVGIHVDTTQRGRLGYRDAATEEALNPLRDELAGLLRRARAHTGLRLKAATTVTVEPRNLPGVPAVVRWLLHNADVFQMVSFQPMAQVGRTEAGLGGGVSVEALWAAIAEGLEGAADAPALRLARGTMWAGHPGCNRYVPGAVLRRVGHAPSFHPVREVGDPVDERDTGAFYARWGGVTFRDVPRAEALGKALGMLLGGAGLLARRLPGFVRHWLWRLDPAHPWRTGLALLRGRARLDWLVLVSHHFMSAEELATPLGQERLAMCVFQVPVDGQPRSMCEVNALGLRERYYAQLQARAHAGAQPAGGCA
jgi:Radical SAM superfamily